jgi:glycosyltransferase involved in cell wall biosynthesis
MKTRFSILIPTYNRKGLVLQAIDSIMAQTFKDYEVFVIDDGSTDGTQDALRGYLDRIHFLQQPNQGPEVARNFAARRANGEYLALLDSDDLLMPHALETYDQVLRKFNSPPVLIGSMMYFNKEAGLPPTSNNGGIEVLKYPDYLSKDVGIALSNSRIVMRKSLYDKVGGARNSSPNTFHCDDFHLILKTGTYGPCVIVQKPVTVAYRVHNSNSVRSVAPMVRGVLSLIGSERNGEYPGGIRCKFGRYACIGGIAQRWVGRAWQASQYKASLMLLFRSLPMISAAVGKKVFTKCQPKNPPVILSDTQPANT